MSTHAMLSPSSAERWMTCPGSVALTRDLPDSSSDYADEGTAAHALAAMAFTEGKLPSAYIGRRIEVGEFKTVEVTAEMAEHVSTYLSAVAAHAVGGERFVEQAVPIGHITGETGATGTADFVVLLPGELQVHDLKYGRGVPVSALGNPQLRLYGLGALEAFGDFAVEPIERVRVFIHQPRLGSISDEVIPVRELEAFRQQAEQASYRVWQALSGAENDGVLPPEYLQPSEDACRWCKAKATCPALAAKVQEEVGADFEDLNAVLADEVITYVAGRDDASLAQKMAACDLIEDWIKAVRAEVESRLLAGHWVPGYKLVAGRKGARAWSDAEAVESYLKKTARLKVEEMYDLKLISPTTAEKLVKAKTLGPGQWAKLQPYITQSEGRPSVAPESDPRPALTVQATADDFEDVSHADIV